MFQNPIEAIYLRACMDARRARGCTIRQGKFEKVLMAIEDAYPGEVAEFIGRIAPSLDQPVASNLHHRDHT